MENYLQIKELIEKGVKGYHVGNRLILPFQCQVIKIIIESKIITNFGETQEVRVVQDPHNTSIYFGFTTKLKSYIKDYNLLKLLVCSIEDNLCEVNKHIKLVCELEDPHDVIISKPGKDVLFIS